MPVGPYWWGTRLVNGRMWYDTRVRCRECDRDRPEDDFPWRDKAKGLRQTRCSRCERAYGKAWYQANKARRSKQIRAKNREANQRNRRLLAEYLTEHPCVDCGEPELVVLEFDHVRGTKKRNISRMLECAMSWGAIMEEVEKCDVVCANCHRRRTARRGWRDDNPKLAGVVQKEGAPLL